jgi:hypothetical protein
LTNTTIIGTPGVQSVCYIAGSVSCTNGIGSFAAYVCKFYPTGITNTLAHNNLRIFGFTGTGVIYTNFYSHIGASLGTITTPIPEDLQPGEALFGTGCTEATNVSL